MQGGSGALGFVWGEGCSSTGPAPTMHAHHAGGGLQQQEGCCSGKACRGAVIAGVCCLDGWLFAVQEGLQRVGPELCCRWGLQ
jgi:hypothetical protein